MKRYIPKSFDINRALTFDTFTEGLDALGYHRTADRNASGLGNPRYIEPPRCIYWVERDGSVTIIDNEGSEIDAGDDGDGWVIDSEPVDELADALAMFEVDVAAELER